MMTTQREGVLVTPHCRLSDHQVAAVDSVSRELLWDPGVCCRTPDVVALFRDAGATIEDTDEGARIRIPEAMLDRALETAPSTVVLGARDPDNRLVLDAHEPRVRFVSGSETNVWLDVRFDGDVPRFERLPGAIDRLRDAAHLAENLEHLDSFIRCVNIQDPGVKAENKDVNKFLASLDNITKHVMAGLTSLDALDDVMRMGQIIAGGEAAFAENPIFSFITCVVKSPFQIVDDTAEKLMAIARRKVPVVISSCPMGGATGPFDEFGMVAQINAEVLAGIILVQLTCSGAPVLYGSVPVRTRLDNLNDMYGAPEFNHYNLDCAQMARHYGMPCYSTAGVADTEEPGIQATFEKMLTLMDVPRGGAQYVHYAFGLLERTNTFCPEQAVLDNAHIGCIKRVLADSPIAAEQAGETLSMIREVMASSHKTYMYHVPLPTRDPVYVRYPLEDEGGALKGAQKAYHEILARPRKPLPVEIRERLRKQVPGILPATLPDLP